MKKLLGKIHHIRVGTPIFSVAKYLSHNNLGKNYNTPVFLPGEFHGLYGPWGHKESDTTEQPSLSLSGDLL